MILIKLSIISFALLYSTVTFAGNFEISNHQSAPDEFVGPLEEKDQLTISRKISSINSTTDLNDDEFVGPPSLENTFIQND